MLHDKISEETKKIKIASHNKHYRQKTNNKHNTK